MIMGIRGVKVLIMVYSTISEAGLPTIDESDKAIGRRGATKSLQTEPIAIDKDLRKLPLNFLPRHHRHHLQYLR